MVKIDINKTVTWHSPSMPSYIWIGTWLKLATVGLEGFRMFDCYCRIQTHHAVGRGSFSRQLFSLTYRGAGNHPLGHNVSMDRHASWVANEQYGGHPIEKGPYHNHCYEIVRHYKKYGLGFMAGIYDYDT